MRAQFRHYQELAELISWFKTWYGGSWERKVREGADVYRGEMSSALRGHKAFSRLLLPKLRRLKLQLETGVKLSHSRPRAGIFVGSSHSRIY